ncbi:hypothetical protein I5M32_03885 [Pedobacter sp. SD-b]|uniref:Uncharacterized protein n=1 Tax=Pedobacter segetis TaxID=2793069 RepID=A0ABS1BIA9_9SPHI|nr:hypothetical protein [Pedobacter segetis]MBK0382091.1 hypothetical protein [Pedobacter segetis]
MYNKKIKSIITLISLVGLASCSRDKTGAPAKPTDPVINAEKQNLVLNSEDYKQEFLGGGVSIGLFLGHHYSMSATAQDQAVRLIAKDCNMQYLQDYIEIYPADDPEYFDRRANYIKAAKAYQPDLKFSLVGNKFPADLMHDIVVNGETLQALNTDDPAIYDKVANWWYKMTEGFYQRGVATDILNVVNEPDLDRTFRKNHYGLAGDTKEAVARVFKYAVPKYKAMLANPSISTLNMKTPLIMGPSTISPVGCLDYIQYFKTNHPDVWKGIDIVSTHQYENGGRPELFQTIMSQADGKPIYQSETHALMGDALNFNGVFISKALNAALSLSNLFCTAVNNGVSSWWYFETNYPNVEVHPGGLLSIPWAAQEPIPYKHYYAFKQLTSAQPASSNVIGYVLENKPNTQVIAFRKKNQNVIYADYSNYNTKPMNVSITVKGTNGNRKIAGYTLTTTSELDNGALLKDTTFASPQDAAVIFTKNLSLNTIKLNLAN